MDPALAIELAALSRQKAMNEAISRGDSPVQQFYSNAVVFVTGGTGFLGKQLIEKLFRSCNIKKLYVLLRPKKGMEIRERMEKTLEDPVFEMVRKIKPKFADNIEPVEGDVSDINLGLSDKDWNKLTEEVDIVFHLAATTRFDESLRLATLINIRGTRETVNLGKACKKLKSFVFVSTTFANATNNSADSEVFEKFYPSPVAPEVMIKMVETVDQDRLSAIESNFIKGYPNTYTFTKAIAEEVVRSTAGNMPISIVRPAVVISSYREPVPGWADSSCAYGASGMILGPATGLIHTSYAKDETNYSIVPVDYVNNAILAAGFRSTVRSGSEPPIYSVSSARNLFQYSQVANKVREVGRVLPTPMAVWYVFILETSNKLLFLTLTWLLHYIPGYALDAVYRLLGKPPMFIKLYNRVYRTSLALSYFTTHSWIFNDENSDKLYKSLSPVDKLIFNFDTTDINQTEFITLWCVGLRKYLIKDGIKNTVYARKKQFCLRIIHYIVVILYAFVLYKIISLFFSSVTYVFGLIY